MPNTNNFKIKVANPPKKNDLNYIFERSEFRSAIKTGKEQHEKSEGSPSIPNISFFALH